MPAMNWTVGGHLCILYASLQPAVCVRYNNGAVQGLQLVKFCELGKNLWNLDNFSEDDHFPFTKETCFAISWTNCECFSYLTQQNQDRTRTVLTQNDFSYTLIIYRLKNKKNVKRPFCKVRNYKKPPRLFHGYLLLHDVTITSVF